MYTNTGYNIHGTFPLLFLPVLIPLCSPFWPLFTYLETLLAVTGSVHLGLRLLVNRHPLLNPFPNPSPLQIPRTRFIRRLTMTTSRTRRLLSGTVQYLALKLCNQRCNHPKIHQEESYLALELSDQRFNGQEEYINLKFFVT
jgi:hypothetical protein